MRFLIVALLGLVWTANCPAQSSRYLQPGIKSTIPRHSPPIPQINPVIPRIGEPSCQSGRVYGPIYDPYLAGWSHGGWGPFGSAGYSNGLYYGPTVGFGVNYGFHDGYGYSNLGYPVSPWGPVYTTAPQPSVQPLPQWMLDDAGLGQPIKVRPTARRDPSLLEPSTPGAQLRSARMQGIGDRFLRDRDFTAAEKSYRSAIESAPDRPEPYVRLALVKVARDDYRGAVAALREAITVDPRFPERAESLDLILGPEQHGTKVQLKQKVADWTKVNVRDADRLFLLAVLMFLDGDNRCHTLLDTAIQLDGGREHLTAFREATVSSRPGVNVPGLLELPGEEAPPPEATPEGRPLPRAPLLVPSDPTPVPEL